MGLPTGTSEDIGAAVDVLLANPLPDVPPTNGDMPHHIAVAYMSIAQKLGETCDMSDVGVTKAARDCHNKMAQPELRDVITGVITFQLPNVLWAYMRLSAAVEKLYEHRRFHWIASRKETILGINKAAFDISHTSDAEAAERGASAGFKIAAGALGLLGLIAAPFTFGGSLALTGLSAAMDFGAAAADYTAELSESAAINEVMGHVKSTLLAEADATTQLQQLIRDVAEAWGSLNDAMSHVTHCMLSSLSFLPAETWAKCSQHCGSEITLGDVMNGWAYMHYAMIDRFLVAVAVKQGYDGLRAVVDGADLVSKEVKVINRIQSLAVTYDSMRLASVRLSSAAGDELGYVSGSIMSDSTVGKAALKDAAERFALEEAATAGAKKIPLLGSALAKAGGRVTIVFAAFASVKEVADGISALVKGTSLDSPERLAAQERLHMLASDLLAEFGNVCSALAAFAPAIILPRQPGPDRLWFGDYSSLDPYPKSDGSGMSTMLDFNGEHSVLPGNILSCDQPYRDYLLSPGGYFRLDLLQDGTLTLGTNLKNGGHVCWQFKPKEHHRDYMLSLYLDSSGRASAYLQAQGGVCLLPFTPARKRPGRDDRDMALVLRDNGKLVWLPNKFRAWQG